MLPTHQPSCNLLHFVIHYPKLELDYFPDAGLAEFQLNVVLVRVVGAQSQGDTLGGLSRGLTVHDRLRLGEG